MLRIDNRHPSTATVYGAYVSNFTAMKSDAVSATSAAAAARQLLALSASEIANRDNNLTPTSNQPSLRRVTAVVLAGGASQRCSDKLAEEVDGRPLLDRTLTSLPEQITVVVVVGAVRKVARPVIFTSEDPPGGGPAAALVAGVRRALAEPSDAIVTLPADAPLGGQAAGTLLSRLESEPSTDAVVGVDAQGWEQPLQLALRPVPPVPCWQQLDQAVQRGLGAPPTRCTPARTGRPGTRAGRALGHRHARSAARLAAQSSAAVSAILELAAQRQSRIDRPVVIAIDGPSCAGKSILATAVALRAGVQSSKATTSTGTCCQGSAWPSGTRCRTPRSSMP